jgi:hypothetical protein
MTIVGIRETPQEPSSAETITGVAFLCNDGRVFALPRPHRHHHLFSLAAFVGDNADPCDQGFMTSAGRYVGREEAQNIARAAGQPFTASGGRSDPKLYSEDVW